MAWGVEYADAMGGGLEITAIFPDGAIQISQFEGIAAKTERGSLPSSD
ncbi:MAG: hypothetical protein NT140_12050 [Deltaproteobacteria bacterium]|nr:hypothetical protein [Deltaproteobacteria bacterium]